MTFGRSIEEEEIANPHAARAAPYVSERVFERLREQVGPAPHVTSQPGMAGAEYYKSLEREPPRAKPANANDPSAASGDQAGSDWLSPLHAIDTPFEDRAAPPQNSGSAGPRGFGAEPPPAPGINNLKRDASQPGRSTAKVNVIAAPDDKMSKLRSEVALRLANNHHNLSPDQVNQWAERIENRELNPNGEPLHPPGQSPQPSHADQKPAAAAKTAPPSPLNVEMDDAEGDAGPNASGAQARHKRHRKGGAATAMPMPQAAPSPPQGMG